jgi:phosphate starvation-inducible PhoH-like protein
LIRTKAALRQAPRPKPAPVRLCDQLHDINFGIGPAGTGKTYLAVACAVRAVTQRAGQAHTAGAPAVEAGERLGFLPGDLSQKVDPYLRPLYDALYEMLGFETVNKYIERHIIEVAPLALCAVARSITPSSFLTRHKTPLASR